MIHHLFAFGFFLGMALDVQSQGNFQNLDFESANLNPVPPGEYGGLVPVALAFPGWTGYAGTNQVSQTRQNALTLGAPNLAIFGPNWTNDVIIEGFYTAVLQPGVNPPSPAVSVSLAQTGLVPATAKSIELKLLGDISVSLAGQPVQLAPSGNGANYVLFRGDVSQFAGQVVELRFTAFAEPGHTTGLDYLDSIQFSDIAIPEPSVLGLMVVRLAALAWRRERKS